MQRAGKTCGRIALEDGGGWAMLKRRTKLMDVKVRGGIAFEDVGWWAVHPKFRG